MHRSAPALNEIPPRWRTTFSPRFLSALPFVALAWLTVVALPAAAVVPVGTAAPPLALRTAGGGEFRLEAEVREHDVLLAFVAPRCKPCEESRPALARLERDAGKALRVVTVVLSQDSSRPSPSAAVPRSETPSDTLLYADAATAEAYGVFGAPVFVLVDRQGRVRWNHVGRLPLEAVDRALGALSPSVVAVRP